MLVLERFENDTAIIETPAGHIVLPRTELPPEVKEGDILVISSSPAATEQRRERVAALQNLLFKNL